MTYFPSFDMNTMHTCTVLVVCVRVCVWTSILGGINWNLCLTVHCNFSRSDGSLYVTLALSLSRSHVCFRRRRRAFVARGGGRHSTDIVHLAQQRTKTKALPSVQRLPVVGQQRDLKGKGEFKWSGFCRSSRISKSGTSKI